MERRSQAGIKAACLLFGLVCIAYAPCFGAGFLNYDDPWLIANNRILAPGSSGALAAIWTDFRFDTRFALGAEYLPLRDMLVWLELALFGKSAPAMHAVSVLIYGSACLAFRAYLVASFGRGWLPEVGALVFALHPVHVESVAWLAGQKDVLALLFIALALWQHARARRAARFWVPIFVTCACLSKSMSVAVIVLLMATDLAQRRKFDPVIYGTCGVAIACALALHLYVGSVVHMIATPLGGSRLHAFWSMGPVWLRYLGLCLFPWQLSIEHVVEPLTEPTLQSLLGYAFVAVSAVASLLAWRRARTLPLVVFLWFFGPLLPVSQVLAPLQNRMADRYLWLSVMALGLICGAGIAWLARRARSYVLPYAAVTIACTGLLAASFDRAVLFSDSVLLFTDGVQKNQTGVISLYQLASALDESGRPRDAEVAYQEVLRRVPTERVDTARRATNNLAKLLAARGRLPEAEAVLRSGLVRFPKDEKMRGNLAKVLSSLGREQEAASFRTPIATPSGTKHEAAERP